MSSAPWVGLLEMFRVLGSRVLPIQVTPERARGLGLPTLLLGSAAAEASAASSPPAESPPPTLGPQTRLRPARTRFVWFSPSGLFLEFLPFSLFLYLWGPPSPLCGWRVGGPDPALSPRFHRTGEGDPGAQDTRKHLSLLHTRIQELPMRSAQDVTLLGMWVPDSASPSSPPPDSQRRPGGASNI